MISSSNVFDRFSGFPNILRKDIKDFQLEICQPCRLSRSNDFWSAREIGFIIFKSSDNSYWNSISQKRQEIFFKKGIFCKCFAFFFFLILLIYSRKALWITWQKWVRGWELPSGRCFNCFFNCFTAEVRKRGQSRWKLWRIKKSKYQNFKISKYQNIKISTRRPSNICPGIRIASRLSSNQWWCKNNQRQIKITPDDLWWPNKYKKANIWLFWSIFGHLCRIRLLMLE